MASAQAPAKPVRVMLMRYETASGVNNRTEDNGRSWARRCPSALWGGEVELRPMRPEMGLKPGAGK
jgi:hypothetical protein